MKTIVIFDQAETAGGSIARAVDLANELSEYRFIFITYRPLNELSNAKLKSNITAKRIYSFYNYATKSSHHRLLKKIRSKALTQIGEKLITFFDLINECSVLWQSLLKLWRIKADTVQANGGIHILPYRLAILKKSSLIYYFRHLDDYRWAEGKVIDRGNHYIFVSSNLMQAHLKTLKNISLKKCQVTHSPFDVNSRLEKEPLGNYQELENLKLANKKILLCNSRISYAKGQHVIVEAFHQISSHWPNLILLFVGAASNQKADKQYLEQIQQKISQYNLTDKVIFLGHRNDALHVMQYADIAVQAPVYFEALAGSLVESLQLGIPTISSAIGGNTEVIIDQQTGYLFPPGDHQALARIIDQLLRSPENANEIAARGKCHATLHWHPQKITAQIRKIYDENTG